MTSRRAAAVICALAIAGIVAPTLDPRLRSWCSRRRRGRLGRDGSPHPRRGGDGLLLGPGLRRHTGGAADRGRLRIAGPSVEALRVVPLALFASAALLTWRIGVRTVGEPYARIAAAVVWVWPVVPDWKSTRAHGFYGAASCWACRRAARPALAERPSRRDAAVLLGLALGLGWWATPQVLCSTCPRSPGWSGGGRCSARAGSLVAAAALGALPVARLERDARLVLAEHAAVEGRSVRRVHNLLASTLPTALGARLPFTLEWVGGAVVGACLYGALLAAIVWTLVRRRTELGPLVPILATFPLFYALSPYTWLITEPRYLVLLGPLFALVLVAAGGPQAVAPRSPVRSPRSRRSESACSIRRMWRSRTRMAW